MTAKEILALQRRQPFSGLRIHVSDGEAYEVLHPEMMAVTRTCVFIALPPLADGVPERSVYCDPVHITRVEPMNASKRSAPRKRRKS
ncbi:MAG: hypothetical protein WBE26_05240 [Phycisphaerae bacterium]